MKLHPHKALRPAFTVSIALAAAACQQHAPAAAPDTAPPVPTVTPAPTASNLPPHTAPLPRVTESPAPAPFLLAVCAEPDSTKEKPNNTSYALEYPVEIASRGDTAEIRDSKGLSIKSPQYTECLLQSRLALTSTPLKEGHSKPGGQVAYLCKPLEAMGSDGITFIPPRLTHFYNDLGGGKGGFLTDHPSDATKEIRFEAPEGGMYCTAQEPGTPPAAPVKPQMMVMR